MCQRGNEFSSEQVHNSVAGLVAPFREHHWAKYVGTTEVRFASNKPSLFRVAYVTKKHIFKKNVSVAIYRNLL